MRESQLKHFLLVSSSVLMGLALIYLVVRYALWWLLPFIIAFGVSTLLEPVILFLQKKLHFRRNFSAAFLTLFLLFLAGGLLSFLFSTLFSEANSFLSQAGAMLDMLPSLIQSALARFEEYCSLCPPWLQEYLHSFLGDWALQSSTALDAAIAKLLSWLTSLASALPHVLLSCATTILAIYFTSTAYPAIRTVLRKKLSHNGLQQMRHLRSGMIQTLSRWLRAQLTLCFITFLQLLAGFLLMRQEFSLLLAFLITLVDALPVFGTGTILLPWAVLCFLFGNSPKALLLLALYACTLLVRNILEPKLMAKQAGLPPIASLAAMYLGFSSFGIVGMILFPFLLLLCTQLIKKSDSNHAD